MEMPSSLPCTPCSYTGGSVCQHPYWQLPSSWGSPTCAPGPRARAQPAFTGCAAPRLPPAQQCGLVWDPAAPAQHVAAAARRPADATLLQAVVRARGPKAVCSAWVDQWTPSALWAVGPLHDLSATNPATGASGSKASSAAVLPGKQSQQQQQPGECHGPAVSLQQWAGLVRAPPLLVCSALLQPQPAATSTQKASLTPPGLTCSAAPAVMLAQERARLGPAGPIADRMLGHGGLGAQLDRLKLGDIARPVAPSGSSSYRHDHMFGSVRGVLEGGGQLLSVAGARQGTDRPLQQQPQPHVEKAVVQPAAAVVQPAPLDAGQLAAIAQLRGAIDEAALAATAGPSSADRAAANMARRLEAAAAARQLPGIQQQSQPLGLQQHELSVQPAHGRALQPRDAAAAGSTALAVQVQAQPAPAAKVKVQPAPSAQPKVQPASAVKAEAQPAQAAQPKVQPTPPVQPKPQPALTAQPKVQQTLAAQPKAQPTPAAQAKVQPTPAAQPKAQPTPAAQPKAQPAQAAQPKAQPTPAAQSTVPLTPAAQPKVQPTPPAQPKAQPAPAAKAEPQPTPTAKGEATPAPAAQPTPAAAAKVQPAPAAEALAAVPATEGAAAAGTPARLLRAVTAQLAALVAPLRGDGRPKAAALLPEHYLLEVPAWLTWQPQPQQAQQGLAEPAEPGTAAGLALAQKQPQAEQFLLQPPEWLTWQPAVAGAPGSQSATPGLASQPAALSRAAAWAAALAAGVVGAVLAARALLPPAGAAVAGAASQEQLMQPSPFASDDGGDMEEEAAAGGALRRVARRAAPVRSGSRRAAAGSSSAAPAPARTPVTRRRAAATAAAEAAQSREEDPEAALGVEADYRWLRTTMHQRGTPSPDARRHNSIITEHWWVAPCCPGHASTCIRWVARCSSCVYARKSPLVPEGCPHCCPLGCHCRHRPPPGCPCRLCRLRSGLVTTLSSGLDAELNAEVQALVGSEGRRSPFSRRR